MKAGEKFGGFTFKEDGWAYCDTCGFRCAGLIPMAAHSGDCFLKDTLAGLKELANNKGNDLTTDDIGNFLDQQ